MRVLVACEYLRSRLRYEPETGRLFWNERPREQFNSDRDWKKWNTRYAGKEAFTANSHGYRAGAVDDRKMLAHRVAWAVWTGAWPENEIDHINGDRSDNRAANLRDVARATNHKNQKRRATNTSGCLGVSLTRNNASWRARITVDGSELHLGSFPTKSAAIAARKAAELRFGFHKNHGRVA